MRDWIADPDGGVLPGGLRLSTWLSVLFAMLAVALLYSPVGASMAFGILGTVLVAVGSHRTDRIGINYGLLFLLGGVLVGGFGTIAPGRRLAAALLAVLAWDVARYGLVIEEQLGAAARTERIELTHAASSVAVGVAGTGLCYGLFLVSSGARSFTALGLLAVGAFALTAALR